MDKKVNRNDIFYRIKTRIYSKIWRRSAWWFSLVLVIVMVLQFMGIFTSNEYAVEDLFYQQGSLASSKIYVIGIDSMTMMSHQESFDYWIRDDLAKMINILNADPDHKPAVIGIDINLFGKKDEAQDAALVEAVRNAGNVVLSDNATVGAAAGIGENVVVAYERSFKELNDVAFGRGFSNTFFDTDGVIRHHTGSLMHDNQKEYSFSYTVARAYAESHNIHVDWEKFEKEFYIRYSGKLHAYYGTTTAGCSLVRVLSGDYPAIAFDDAIVLVGAYAPGMQDNFYTAIDKGMQMYGVEINANIVNQMIDNECKNELGHFESLLPTLILGLISIAILVYTNSSLAILINMVLCVLYVALGSWLYQGALDLTLPIMPPVVAVILMTIVGEIYGRLVASKEKHEIILKYSKYLSPEMANIVAKSGEESLELGGVKKNIAVLFVDIRSFTTISERMQPEQVVAMLNEYFKITSSAITNNGGNIDKYIGDSTMGLFNGLLDLDDYVYHAVEAGLEMLGRMHELTNILPFDNNMKVNFGIGVHYGEAVVGNIGTDARMEYTAIGDTVNTASRLESSAKPGQLLVSEEVYTLLKDRVNFDDAGEIALKGKANKMHAYSVISLKKTD